MNNWKEDGRMKNPKMKKRDVNFKFDPMFIVKVKKFTDRWGITMTAVAEKGMMMYMEYIEGAKYPEIGKVLCKTKEKS